MSRTRKVLKLTIFLSGLGILLISIVVPPIFGLDILAQKTIGIFFLTISLWITGYLPPAITGLLVLGLVPLLQIIPPSETFSLFGNRAVFFILGVFIISASFMKTGLAKRLTLFFFILFKGSPFRIIIGVYFIAFFFSLLMPEHAVAALLFPILLKMDHLLQIKNKKFEALLFLSMAWGCVSGGIGTPLGGARAPLAIGLLQENFGVEIEFLRWTQMAIPLAVLLFIFSIVYIYLLTRNLPAHIKEKINSIKLEESPAEISQDEKKVIFIYGIALFGWIFLNRVVDMAVVAILSSILLFIFKVITWKDVESYVNWGIILMYGGAIVLGKTMVESGAASWFALNILFPLAHSPWSTFWLFVITTIAFTEMMSNVATCAFILPIAYGFVSILNIDPFFVTLMVAIPSGLAFLLPIGTPANAIAFSSGKYSISRGVILGISYIPFSLLSLYLVAKFVWSFMGLKL